MPSAFDSTPPLTDLVIIFLSRSIFPAIPSVTSPADNTDDAEYFENTAAAPLELE
ncbi:hypothetical protein LguiA_010131 [Lonicera macranthoides]